MCRLRQSWCGMPERYVSLLTGSMPACMQTAVVLQVRTGTNRSMKGHRDPALTWEVPPALQKVSIGPACWRPSMKCKTVFTLSSEVHETCRLVWK